MLDEARVFGPYILVRKLGGRVVRLRGVRVGVERGGAVGRTRGLPTMQLSRLVWELPRALQKRKPSFLDSHPFAYLDSPSPPFTSTILSVACSAHYAISSTVHGDGSHVKFCTTIQQNVCIHMYTYIFIYDIDIYMCTYRYTCQLKVVANILTP